MASNGRSMNSPLVPAGVEAHFNREKNTELELQMLRHFFASWQALHNLPREDKDHRKKAEAAAQVLVDAAQSIVALREQPRVLNG